MQSEHGKMGIEYVMDNNPQPSEGHVEEMREESSGKDNPWDPKSSLLSRARFVNSWDYEVDKNSWVPTQKRHKRKKLCVW